MTFDQLVLSNNTETTSFNNFFEKSIVFSEASYDNYLNDIEDIRLRVAKNELTTESGKDAIDKASEGFIVRSTKFISGLIENFLKWVQKIYNNIKEFFESSKTMMILSKSEEAIKNDPKKKSKKVEVADSDKIDKLCGVYECKVDKILAKLKSKSFTEKDAKELDNLEEQFEKDHDKISKSTILIAVTAAIAGCSVIMGKMTKEHESCEKLGKEDMKISSEDTPIDVDRKCQAIGLKTRIKKSKISNLDRSLHEYIRRIKEVVTDSKPVTESSENIKFKNNDIGKVSQESTLDYDEYLNDIIDDVEESADSITISDMNDTDMVESTYDSNELENYLTMLEKEITEVDDSFDPEAYLESMESELFESENYTLVDAEAYLQSLENECFN